MYMPMPTVCIEHACFFLPQVSSPTRPKCPTEQQGMYVGKNLNLVLYVCAQKLNVLFPLPSRTAGFNTQAGGMHVSQPLVYIPTVIRE